MPKIKKIPATKRLYSSEPINTKKKRRVAAYARVSTDSEEQLTSYEAQKEHYEKYIKQNENWQYVGIYADEGISAVSIKNRDQFMSMINDALAGKIDLIITKSVSRFARNTVDSLETVRKLKDNGIEVYFEKENIYTFDGKGELLITIMSSLAQEESRSISENVTWGCRHRFQEGKVSMPFGSFLGYERGEDGRPKIVEQEAKTVRFIYQKFLEGWTPSYIAKYLTEQGIRTPMKKEKWSVSTVGSILRNEKYNGSALLQKTFTVDFLTKKQKKNDGEVTRYFIEDSHPAIISKEIYNLAQIEFERRRAERNYKPTASCLSGKLFCGDCGCMYGSKVWHSTDKYRKVIWQCNDKFKKKTKNQCATPNTTEEKLKAAFVDVFNDIISDKDTVIAFSIATVQRLMNTSALDRHMLIAQKNLDDKLQDIKDYIDLNQTTVIDQKKYNKHFDELSAIADKASEAVREIEQKKNEIIHRRERPEAFLKMLTEHDTVLEEFDEGLFAATVDKVMVYADKLMFVFKDGFQKEYFI